MLAVTVLVAAGCGGDVELVTTTEGGATTITTQPATTTSAPTTTAATTTVPLNPVDVTAEGTVSVSSIFSGDFPAGLSVDGDPSTSWFSAGSTADGDFSTFTWTIGQDEEISQIDILSNAGHSVADFRENFGFASMVVTITNSAGEVVFEATEQLPGTPDPEVTLIPNVGGSTIEIVFQGHESADCGGFGELVVTALRA